MKSAVFSLLLLLPAAVQGQNAQPPDLLRDASAAHASGDMGKAVQLYREFLKEYPLAAEIRSNLGAALVRDGRFAEAIPEYKLALEKLPNNSGVRMNLALAYYKLGRMPEAIEALGELRKLQPVELKPALLLADCLMQTDQMQKAVDLLTEFQAEYPDERALVYLLGMALLKLNRMEQAQVYLDRILRDGESAESAYLMGQSEFLRQKEVAAAEHLARAVKLNPNLPGAHSLYGTVLRNIGKAEMAAEQFRLELKANPYDFVGNLETAMLLKQDGKLDEALAHIQRALQVRPADPGALYQRASLHFIQGGHEQARQEFEQLVADFPGFAEAHAGLASVYYRLKRKEDGDRERAAAQRVQEENVKQLEEARKRAAEARK